MKNIKDKILFLSVLLNIVFVFSFFQNFEKGNTNRVEQNQNQIAEKKENKYNGFYDVVRVVDGDTLILKMNDKNQRVRLVGINTPESMAVNGRVVECFGQEAKKEAKRILEGQKVYFEVQENDYFDKNGRMLGFVFLKNQDGKYTENFSETMIKNGFGYEYTYKGRFYKYQKEFKAAQKSAQKNQAGLWNKENGCK
ncbi:hypothetical protein CSB11_00870 [Candidatus Campbellbacteria bacterium]|nr:MAG: hypothetical protein CSB11_00870 [Candidatus Campbellbacteria bacterium]